MRHVRKSRPRVTRDLPITKIRTESVSPEAPLSNVSYANNVATKKRANNVIDALSIHFEKWHPRVVKKEA